MKKIILLTAVSVIATSCQTLQKSERDPASEENSKIYSYQNLASCEPEPNADAAQAPKFSALTGLLVGPGAIQEMRAEAILRPFTSDGCSSSPDGLPLSIANSRVWVHCCVKHDTKYWLGGTEEQKEEADKDLEQCIAKTGHPDIAKLYRLFVKRFGGPNSHSSYRWGYGWSGQRAYAPLTQVEMNQAQSMYSMEGTQIYQVLAVSTRVLQSACSTNDPIFNGLSKEEELIYQSLNSKLKRNDIIEWAKPGYFNLDRKEFDMKLKSCDQPVKFIFSKKTSEISVETDCQF